MRPLEYGAAIAALPATDTVKRGDARPVSSSDTLPRDEIFLAQTPQAFRVDVLRDALALASASADATDEAMLAERAGHRVHLVDGDPRNLKITTPDDLATGRAPGRRRASGAPTLRIGNGYDLHRLVAGRPLILGGVTIPFEKGLRRTLRRRRRLSRRHRRDSRRRRRRRHRPPLSRIPTRAWKDADSLVLLRARRGDRRRAPASPSSTSTSS